MRRSLPISAGIGRMTRRGGVDATGPWWTSLAAAGRI
jgi:hypothetical protein